MKADIIASQGKTGRVSAMSITSFGRLYKRIRKVIVTRVAEVFEAISRITTSIELDSEID